MDDLDAFIDYVDAVDNTGPFQLLDREVIANIFKYLTIPEQILCGRSVCTHFRVVSLEHGPVSFLGRPLQSVQGSPHCGSFHNDYKGLSLYLYKSESGRHGHSFVDAEVPVEPKVGHLAVGVFFRLKMQPLRPNGGYCSLLLSRNNGDPGYLEIKFDGKLLRGYGGALTSEDFSTRADSVENGKWLQLCMRFDWQSSTVKLFVDGFLIHVLKLNDKGWNGVHSIKFRGYICSPYEHHSQAWSHVYVEPIF
jgi:hypothetical protein